MSPDEPRERLASILAEPSEDAWLALCRLIVGWPREAGVVPVSRIDAALAGWPAPLRHIYSDWIRLGHGGAAGPLGRLARCLTIYRRSDDAERHLARVASSPDLGALQRLTIDRSEISWPALAAFCASASLPSLRELEISGVCLGGEVPPALSGSSAVVSPRIPASEGAGGRLLPRLERLRLNSCELGGAGLTTWLRGLEGGRLRILELRRNRLRDYDLALLTGWSGFDELRELDLRDNPLTTAGRERTEARWSRGGGLRIRP